MNKPAALPAPVRRRKCDPALGLDAGEVSARKEAGLVNTQVQPPQKTVWQIILSNTFTYFNILFFFLAGCLIFVGSGIQNLLFLLVVFCNTAIGTVQEIRARNTLSKLTLVSAPRATVVRGGKTFSVPVEELVADDVVILSAGNQIPADAVVLSGEVHVNESLITGEADEIAKQSGDALFSGSFVVSGKAAAGLTKVGSESFVSRLTLEAKKRKKIKKPGMMRSLSVLVRVIGVLIIPLGGFLYYSQFSRTQDVLTAMESSVSTVLGMIPEGLYLLASGALALAVLRLGRKGILSHDLSCVETLARVDVLCVDKTGTITEDGMVFSGLIRAKNCPVSDEELSRLITDFAAASEPDNATILAVREAFGGESVRRAVSRIPFSSRYKFSGVSFGGRDNFLLGAPDRLLGSRYEANADTFRPYLEKGLRVLVFARCDAFASASPQGSVTPLAFLLLENAVRPSAPETFRYFASQGVEIKVISGDHPAAVSQIALKAGIEGAEKYVDATTLTTPKAFAQAAEKYTVFGRVTPEQKRALVRALKRAGHTVAMTGDGVNDVLALKEADCSVAMASGSDVAANVSQIVLLDSDFSAMPAVVDQGRQVINNIQRSASLYLIKNIFSFCTAVFMLLWPLTYPLQPVQLSLLSTLTIGIPSFVLALEPNHERVRGRFLPNVFVRALPAGLADALIILGMMLFAYAFPAFSAAQAGTVTTLLLCIVGFFMLFTLCRPFNLWRAILCGGLVAGFFVLTLGFPELFLLTAPGLGGWLLLIVFSMVAGLFFFFFDRVRESAGTWVREKWEAMREKRR